MEIVKKNVFALCLISLCMTQCISDSEQIDRAIRIAIDSSENALYNGNLHEALYLLDSTKVASVRLNDAERIMLTVQAFRIVNFMETLSMRVIDRSSRYDSLIKLLPNARALKDENLKAEFYIVLADIYTNQGNLDSSLYFENHALELFKISKNTFGESRIRASSLSRLQNRLFREGKEDEVLELIPEFEKEIDFSNLYSKYTLSFNTRHLAQIHLKVTHNYSKSLDLFNQSLELRKEIGFNILMPASYSSIGDVLAAQEKYDSAIVMYSKSIELADEIAFVRYMIYPRIILADIYQKQGKRELAHEILKIALQIAKENSTREFVDLIEVRFSDSEVNVPH